MTACGRSMRRFLSWPDPAIKLNKGEVSVKQHSCMSVKVDMSVTDDVWSCKLGEMSLNTLLLTLASLMSSFVVGKMVDLSRKHTGSISRSCWSTTVVSVVHWWDQAVSPPQLTGCYTDTNVMDRLERVVFSTGDTHVYYRVTCRFVKLNPPLMLSEG